MTVIVKSRQIELTASADDWGLYDVPGRELAADCMNAALVDATAWSGATRRAVSDAAERMMKRFSEFGAMDSEGWQALDRILDEIFGKSAR